MGLRKQFLIIALFLLPIHVFADCDKSSQSIFCRMKSCIEKTHWNYKGIADPIEIIKENENYKFDLLLVPMGHISETFNFYTLQENKFYSYAFSKDQKVGSQCKDDGNFGKFDISGQCKSKIPFGWGCLFKEKPYLRVQPMRVNYWDGRKVNFLCWQWLKKESTHSLYDLNGSRQELKEENISKIITPILKARMKQLVKAIIADEKSIDPQKILSVIKKGEKLSDMGDCRYFLDGNTLNLLMEALEKKFPSLKEAKY